MAHKIESFYQLDLYYVGDSDAQEPTAIRSRQMPRVVVIQPFSSKEKAAEFLRSVGLQEKPMAFWFLPWKYFLWYKVWELTI